MNAPRARSLLFTVDADLARAVEVFIGDRGKLRVFDSAPKFRTALARGHDMLVLVDLRCAEATTLLGELMTSGPDMPVIALGVPGSEPFLEAHRMGVFAAEPLPLDRWSFQLRLGSAFRVMRLALDNEALRREAQANLHPPRAEAPAHASPRTGPTALGKWSRALRNIGDVDALMDGIVHGVADTMLVSRVGLVARAGQDEDFVFRTGIRCLEPSRGRRYTPDDPLAVWLEDQACQVARHQLEHVPDPAVRALLRDELDELGAEIIVPLQGRGHLLGWLFVGQRGTGQPLSVRDQEEFLVVADTVSSTLENALLFEEVTLQKTMAETLLHSMTSGIVAVDTDGLIQSFNQAAATILALPPAEALGQPVAMLGSRLADLLLRALEADLPDLPAEWTHPVSHKSLHAEVRRLSHERTCLGAVAFLHDLTQRRQLEEKQDHLERASFWNDLAASMSHEIRNPLVAIKTFAQLLPERYEDPTFRSDFSELVTQEVDRLNKIIEQINDFAHPPELRFNALDVPQLLQNSIDSALKRAGRNGVDIETSFEDDLPPVWGDGQALGECFSEIIRNALEGASTVPDPRIHLSASLMPSSNGGSDEVTVLVEDNGPGIPGDVLEKVFSPFCTSKAQGMGLGLPIARRTVIDHDGQIDLQSTEHGTRVRVGLPTARNRGAT